MFMYMSIMASSNQGVFKLLDLLLDFSAYEHPYRSIVVDLVEPSLTFSGRFNLWTMKSAVREAIGQIS